MCGNFVPLRACKYIHRASAGDLPKACKMNAGHDLYVNFWIADRDLYQSSGSIYLFEVDGKSSANSINMPGQNKICVTFGIVG